MKVGIYYLEVYFSIKLFANNTWNTAVICFEKFEVALI